MRSIRSTLSLHKMAIYPRNRTGMSKKKYSHLILSCSEFCNSSQKILNINELSMYGITKTHGLKAKIVKQMATNIYCLPLVVGFQK